MKTPGQIAYELELEAVPLYGPGCPRRPSWERLSEIAKRSWEKDPTPRWRKEGLQVVKAR